MSSNLVYTSDSNDANRVRMARVLAAARVKAERLKREADPLYCSRCGGPCRD